MGNTSLEERICQYFYILCIKHTDNLHKRKNIRGCGQNLGLKLRALAFVRTPYLDASRTLDDATKKNDIATHKIEKLKKLSAKAKMSAEQIRILLKKMNTEEYNQVDPYLYKIFRKLSRDVNVSGIQLKCGKGDDLLMLTGDQNKHILNMLSYGQLSVFMLSSFLGNIFWMESYEQFQVYFVDDITSCMDDVNMLAFLDFIKYQLSSEDSAIGQLFFSTCDGRIQDMLRYKMDNCGLEYAEIGIKEFDGQLLAL